MYEYEEIKDITYRDFKIKTSTSYTSNGKDAPILSCQHIVSCGNHHADLDVPVEARTKTAASYDPSKSGPIYTSKEQSSYKDTPQLIQSTPIAGRRDRAKATDPDKFATIKSGSTVDAARIQELINAIQTELDKRGKTYTAITLPTAGSTAYSSIIASLNYIFEQAGQGRPTKLDGRTPANNPLQGSLIAAEPGPNPAIRKINALLRECICYSDCSNFSVCSCYSHCNNY